MPLSYQHELDFTLSLLQKLRMSVHIVHFGARIREYDGGLRALLGLKADDEQAVLASLRFVQERTILKVLDPFMCRYICFQLPGAEPSAFLLLGPYLTIDPTPGSILELAEKLDFPLHMLPQLSEYYAALPVYHDPSVILAIVSTLGEQLWGSREFDMTDVNEEHPSDPAAANAATPSEQENILRRMRLLEERYAYENQMMEIVSKGLVHQAETLMANVSLLNYQPRVSDPLRNMKNYCIICNTIMRKAAQQGGVHPIHIDALSSRFARAIENTPTPEKCIQLINEMITAYCRLVHTQNNRRYSSVIQKTLTYIDANLSGDLSLTALANLLQITPAYLSSLFRRETGSTLSAYILQSRMKTALQLFQTTHLQIQTVAQLCGFSDPNYFSKQFKRCFSVTPQQYRQGQTASSRYQPVAKN